MGRLAAFVLLLALVPSDARATLRGPDCRWIYQVYAHAVAHGKEERFLELTDDYAECVLQDALDGSGRSDALLGTLEARRQLDGGVRLSSYGGAVKAHPLVVKAGFVTVRALSSEARGLYVSSLVRSPDQQLRLLRHRRLGRWAARRSQHVLGGLAVDVAFVGRRRSMAELGRRARQALRRELGAKAALLKVIVEPYCLHIALDPKHAVARREIEARKRELLALGILRRAQPGLIPAVTDYVPESKWRATR